MSELISVQGDPNSHINGELLANNNSGKFFINGKKVVYLNSNSDPDLLCIPIGPPHCNPESIGHSNKVFSEGIPIHRNNDARICGATTIVLGNTKVFSG